MDEQKMVINRETAMRIWSKRYGKDLKVTDFAGRTMVKSAYDDRDSKFGWNIDHILPQSKGGKTAEHNLVCCHILTNDEKADKFPCFNANGHEFEILKVQNHYEIKERSSSNSNNEEQSENDDEVNFYDAADGVRFFKKLKGIQNKWRHTSTIVITLENYETNAIVDFVEELFDGYSISYFLYNENSSIVIVIQANNVPMKEDSALLLDKCVILNTYMQYYFIALDYLDLYDIHYWDDAYKDKDEMYHDFEFNPNSISWNPSNSLFISKSVVENTDAKKRIKYPIDGFNEYNIIYTQLRDDLNKEVSRQD